jgi:hypothetical protein
VHSVDEGVVQSSRRHHHFQKRIPDRVFKRKSSIDLRIIPF